MTAELETVVMPRAWAVFAPNGNVRLCSTDSEPARQLAEKEGLHPVPLYAIPNGYVLVPESPTMDMLYAMAECDGYQRGDRDHPSLVRWEDYWGMALSTLKYNNVIKWPQGIEWPRTDDSIDNTGIHCVLVYDTGVKDKNGMALYKQKEEEQ